MSRRLVGLSLLAALIAFPATSTAQDWDQALMGSVAAFENSRSACYYAPEVEPIIDKMDDYLRGLYGSEWDEGLRQLQLRITPMVNAWRMGGVPECSFYGQAVARGLQIAPIMVGISADAEVARLTGGGARRLTDAPPENVPAPQNPMADFMRDYHAGIEADDVNLLSVDDGKGGYTIAARDIARGSGQVSLLLQAKGSRIDHREVHLDCSTGAVRTSNEFNVSNGYDVFDIKREMEEAQDIALEIFCGP